MLLVSSRLRNFKQKSDHLWNASCPICGDSKTKVRKARFYFYRHKGELSAKCHNCNYSSSFSYFLKNFDQISHRDYAFEKYANKDRHPHVYTPPTQEDLKTPVGPIRDPVQLSIPSILELVEGHPAKAYIASRKIPEKYWSELYFAENYKEFLDRDFAKCASDDVPNDARIVLPMINADGYVAYVTGRSMKRSGLRYITIKILEQKKIFGLNRLDKNLNYPVYVTEGPIDSLFLPNAVASADANLFGKANFLSNLGYTDVILLYDNEPRNWEIVNQMEKAIEAGYKVIIQPHSVSKDLNLMVTDDGWSLEDIQSYIEKHTYQGHKAALEFALWRRTK